MLESLEERVIPTGFPTVTAGHSTTSAPASYAPPKVLASFSGSTSTIPQGNLIEDQSGDLFTTTYSGGAATFFMVILFKGK
jgi:hypothetical protein